MKTKEGYKWVLEKFRSWVNYVIAAGNYLENDSEIYRKIMKSKDLLIKNEDYDEDEADKEAWRKRRALVKEFIEENHDFIAEIENIDTPGPVIPTQNDGTYKLTY